MSKSHLLIAFVLGFVVALAASPSAFEFVYKTGFEHGVQEGRSREHNQQLWEQQASHKNRTLLAESN